jgi:hypothetical protein
MTVAVSYLLGDLLQTVLRKLPKLLLCLVQNLLSIGDIRNFSVGRRKHETQSTLVPNQSSYCCVMPLRLPLLTLTDSKPIEKYPNHYLLVLQAQCQKRFGRY